jgi:PadR family transcriptional regulator PadR
MRSTVAQLKVFSALLNSPGELYGLELMRATGLRSGTLYPLLERMVDEGWVARRWESAENPAGPRRRFYRLTSSGATEGRLRLAEVQAIGVQAWT